VLGEEMKLYIYRSNIKVMVFANNFRDAANKINERLHVMPEINQLEECEYTEMLLIEGYVIPVYKK
jgi:hypothetical protein